MSRTVYPRLIPYTVGITHACSNGFRVLALPTCAVAISISTTGPAAKLSRAKANQFTLLVHKWHKNFLERGNNRRNRAFGLPVRKNYF